MQSTRVRMNEKRFYVRKVDYFQQHISKYARRLLISMARHCLECDVNHHVLLHSQTGFRLSNTFQK